MRTTTVTTDTEKLQREDKAFAERAGHELRNSVEELDAATLSRLNRARQAALDTLNQSPLGSNRRNPWLPLGAAAAVATISVALWQWQTSGPGVDALPTLADQAADIELLLDDGDLDMYAELEFFAWLPEDELEKIG